LVEIIMDESVQFTSSGGLNQRVTFESLGVGNTPLVDISTLVRRGKLFMKAEYSNPFGSSKDRTAVYLLTWAYDLIGPGVQVVESTSGNLGVALATIGSKLGFRPIIVVDTTVSAKQVARIRDAGAHIEMVESPRPGLDMRQTRIEIARELGRRPAHVWLNQYANHAGVQVHRETTGPEIWAQCDGLLDIVVAPVSTGGTICGIGQFIKSVSPNVTVVGVEPLGSTIFGGCYDPSFLIAGAGMRGPCELTSNNGAIIDYFAQVDDATGASFATLINDECGIPVGLSTGLALPVAIQLAEEENKRVVVIAPDTSIGFSQEIADLARANPPARRLPRRVLHEVGDLFGVRGKEAL
jgi:cysteine synthase